MGRIVVTEFISLDGVMQDPGGDSNWKHAGWTFEIEQGEEGANFKIQETRDSEALLLGRVTYEGFAKSWPSVEGEFGEMFNNMPKYVVSTTLDKAEWKNSTVLKGDVVKEVSKLRQKPGGDIVVHGSAQLVQTLLAHDLVDELRLMIFPVILGSGKRLFGDTTDKKTMRLIDSRTVGKGVTILVFQPAARKA